tara:strand:- start:966 stop:1433 length:468 start_codon:yes stop_codon:yes gene_type:complete
MNFDLANNTAVALSYKPTVTTAAANGTGVDLQGYKSATLVAFIGAEGDTLSGSVYFEISLEHSDDNSTFTDVTQSDITNGTIASGGIWLKLDGTTGGDPDTTGLVTQVGYIGGKRYIRGVIAKTGTHSTGTPIGLMVIKGNALHSSDNAITAHNA